MREFKAKIASIHEDLELRRSLEIEEDKTPDFKDQDWILRDAYSFIKNTIKTFDPNWYSNNPEADPVNDLMAAFKQVADQIESRYTKDTPRKTFFNAAEDAEGPSATDDEIAQGEFQEVDKDGDGEAETLIVRIPDMDVEDSITTADRNGSPRPGNYIRIRAQLERLLRDKFGFDIFMGGTPDGKYTLRIYWSDKTGYDKDYFKIVPR